MGLTDKLKVGVKNVSSKINEEADVISLGNKVSSKKKEIDKLYHDIGQFVYVHRIRFSADERDELKSMCSKIDNILKDIAALEEEIKETKEKAHNERESNRSGVM